MKRWRSKRAVATLLIAAVVAGGCDSNGGDDGRPIMVSNQASETATAGDLTREQRRVAVLASEAYLRDSPMSRAQLIDLLSNDYGGEEEVFSVHDAAVGIDSLNVDWVAQAEAQAQRYLALGMGFSKNGLISQLSGEYGGEFTVEEATAAVNSLTVNWDAQAVAYAERQASENAEWSQASVLKEMTRDPATGFTVEEANAAIEAADVDWDEQAANAARQILSRSIASVTCQEMIDRLVEDPHNFTPAQAKEGATRAGACEA